jgi:hypothetical protein
MYRVWGPLKKTIQSSQCGRAFDPAFSPAPVIIATRPKEVIIAEFLGGCYVIIVGYSSAEDL